MVQGSVRCTGAFLWEEEELGMLSITEGLGVNCRQNRSHVISGKASIRLWDRCQVQIQGLL